jgi:hypothetical protein
LGKENPFQTLTIPSDDRYYVNYIYRKHGFSKEDVIKFSAQLDEELLEIKEALTSPEAVLRMAEKQGLLISEKAEKSLRKLRDQEFRYEVLLSTLPNWCDRSDFSKVVPRLSYAYPELKVMLRDPQRPRKEVFGVLRALTRQVSFKALANGIRQLDLRVISDSMSLRPPNKTLWARWKDPDQKVTSASRDWIEAYLTDRSIFKKKEEPYDEIGESLRQPKMAIPKEKRKRKPKQPPLNPSPLITRNPFFIEREDSADSEPDELPSEEEVLLEEEPLRETQDAISYVKDMASKYTTTGDYFVEIPAPPPALVEMALKDEGIMSYLNHIEIVTSDVVKWNNPDSLIPREDRPWSLPRKEQVSFWESKREKPVQNDPLYIRLGISKDINEQIRGLLELGPESKTPKFALRAYAERNEEALNSLRDGTLTGETFNRWIQKKAPKATLQEEWTDFRKGNKANLTRKPNNQAEKKVRSKWDSIKSRLNGKNPNWLPKLPKSVSRKGQDRRKPTPKSHDRGPPQEKGKKLTLEQRMERIENSLYTLSQRGAPRYGFPPYYGQPPPNWSGSNSPQW